MFMISNWVVGHMDQSIVVSIEKPAEMIMSVSKNYRALALHKIIIIIIIIMQFNVNLDFLCLPNNLTHSVNPE